MASASGIAVTSTACHDEAKEAVKAFFEQRFHPKTELENQYRRMEKDCKGIDWTRVEGQEKEILYISSLFDVREWWSKIGREQHGFVFWVAPPMIALPSSNAFQERIFSACTHFDNPIRQRLKESRFEMAVLLAVNESLLECKIPTNEKAQEMVEKVIKRFTDADGMLTAADAMGIDPEADNFLMETNVTQVDPDNMCD